VTADEARDQQVAERARHERRIDPEPTGALDRQLFGQDDADADEHSERMDGDDAEIPRAELEIGEDAVHQRNNSQVMRFLPASAEPPPSPR
jgi:hypothetical protein